MDSNDNWFLLRRVFDWWLSSRGSWGVLGGVGNVERSWHWEETMKRRRGWGRECLIRGREQWGEGLRRWRG